MTKHWLDSNTVRGSLMALVPTVVVIAGLLGLSVSSEELGAIVDAISAVLGAVGVVLAIYGRFTAKEDISFNKES